MPTREPITTNLIPTEAPAAIPVRVVSTRDMRKPRQEPEVAAETKDTNPPASSDKQQPPTTETTAAADSAPPADSVKLSPQSSVRARQEQAFRQREQALKDREKLFEAKLADADHYAQLKTKLSSKDYSAAEALGLRYEDYTQYLLDKAGSEKPEVQAFKKLSDEVTALRADQYEATVSDYRKEIATLVDKDEQYSSIKELKRQDAVLQLILDSWEEDDVEMTVEQAAKDVEDFLVEEAKQMASITKVKAQASGSDKKPLPPPKPGLRTLTQQVTAGSDKRPVKSYQNMSESERYAEARRRVLERKAQ